MESKSENIVKDNLWHVFIIVDSVDTILKPHIKHFLGAVGTSSQSYYGRVSTRLRQ